MIEKIENEKWKFFEECPINFLFKKKKKKKKT